MTDTASTTPAAVLETLRRRLAEPPPGRIQLIAGPRQVGKTTVLLQLAAELGDRASYAAADGPEASLPGYWERFWARVEDGARAGAVPPGVVALVDEVHLIPNWAAALKGYWDRFKRRALPVHIVATGSSALGVTTGSRESLAGRFERIVFPHWSASAIAETFQVPIADAARESVMRGTYPGAWNLRTDPDRWRAYLRDAIIEPAIGRDVLAMTEVRRPALLRQLFAVATGSPASIVSLQKLQGQLADRGALETIAHYLSLLQDAFLVAGLEKFSTRAGRRRAAPAKLVTLNNALITAMHPEGPPQPDREPARFGVWVENACLAAAINQGQRVTYWREEPLEVDAVLEGDRGSWAVEIKTSRFESRDLTGLFEFSRRHPRFRPLVITQPGDEEIARRFGVEAVSWVEYLTTGRRDG